tara:strand:+ start:14 stop:688 length:675 start_codon:yes stop_codon:yes gene_type:complete
VCDPVSAGMFALNAVGQIGEDQANRQGVNARNRARLRQHEHENQDYLNTVKLDNALYMNDVSVAEIEQNEVFSAMVNQWNEQDAQLDRLYAEYDFAVQDEIVEMYQNAYAGEQTGATAARRAAEPYRKKGYEVAKLTADLILNKKEVYAKKERARMEAGFKQNDIFEKVRFAPVHGHTPVPPELEAQPSSSGLLLGLAGAGLQSYGLSKGGFGAKETGMKRGTA